MTEDEVALVQANFSAIEEQGEQLVDDFYQNLFDIQPDLAELFPSNLGEQKKKLIAAIKLVVHGCDQFEKLVPVLAELGEKHMDYGVSIEDYEYVGQALLKALKTASGNLWNLEVEVAWSQAYTAIADSMQPAY